MPLGSSLARQEPSAKVIGNKQQDISLYKYVLYCLNLGVVSLLSMERQIKHYMTPGAVFFSYICNIM